MCFISGIKSVPAGRSGRGSVSTRSGLRWRARRLISRSSSRFSTSRYLRGGARPDPALVPPGVQFGSLGSWAGRTEDPDGGVLGEGSPAGVAVASEADPRRVHLAGQGLRAILPDDECGPAGREIVEYERDLQRVTGAQVTNGAAPGELVDVRR